MHSVLEQERRAPLRLDGPGSLGPQRQRTAFSGGLVRSVRRAAKPDQQGRVAGRVATGHQGWQTNRG